MSLCNASLGFAQLYFSEIHFGRHLHKRDPWGIGVGKEAGAPIQGTHSVSDGVFPLFAWGMATSFRPLFISPAHRLAPCAPKLPTEGPWILQGGLSPRLGLPLTWWTPASFSPLPLPLALTIHLGTSSYSISCKDDSLGSPPSQLCNDVKSQPCNKHIRIYTFVKNTYAYTPL